MNDVSFDLETLGVNPQAMILSIGAVYFDRETGELGETFEAVVDIEAPGGGLIDASTVAWWMRQSQSARDRIFGRDVPRLPLAEALIKFSDFLGYDMIDDVATRSPAMLWQRGDKDAQWLVSAYQGIGLAVPFNYWNVSDQRTLTSLFKPWLPERAKDSIYHGALDDAVYQAQCLASVFARLRATGALLPEPTPSVDSLLLGSEVGVD